MSAIGPTDETETADARRMRLAALGEIAASIAHELRNPLQVIASSAYLAKVDLANALPQLLVIERNARLAQSIVDDVLALARTDALSAERVLLAAVLASAREDPAISRATYEDDLVPEDVAVRAHQGLLARCLHALYENAILASEPRPPLIRTRAAVDQAARAMVIEISDDGPGVPRDKAESIFDPLVTWRRGGTGLGLTLARRIVEAHSGTIELAKDTQAGATFRITLPFS